MRSLMGHYVETMRSVLEADVEKMQSDIRRFIEAMSSEPRFVEVDLTKLVTEGVLMHANEQFFWPLGLALTWTVEGDVMSDLHVREWDYGDPQHHETITLNDADPVVEQRRAAFAEWMDARIEALPEDEREGALEVRARIKSDRAVRTAETGRVSVL